MFSTGLGNDNQNELVNTSQDKDVFVSSVAQQLNANSFEQQLDISNQLNLYNAQVNTVTTQMQIDNTHLESQPLNNIGLATNMLNPINANVSHGAITKTDGLGLLSRTRHEIPRAYSQEKINHEFLQSETDVSKMINEANRKPLDASSDSNDIISENIKNYELINKTYFQEHVGLKIFRDA